MLSCPLEVLYSMKCVADGMAMSRWMILVLGFLVAGACHAEPSAGAAAEEYDEKPADLKLRPLDPSMKPAPGSARFLRGLVRRKLVKRSDCLMAAALVEDPAGWRPDRKACLAILAKVPDLDAGAMGPYDRTASRAFGSLLFVKVLRMRGGLLMRWLPASGRYAYRELESRGMVAPGGPDNALTGEELAGLVEAAGREKSGRRGDGEP